MCERDGKSDRESFKGNKVKKTKEIRLLGYRERVNYTDKMRSYPMKI